MWAAEWAEQLVERGCGQLNGQNSLLREDVGSPMGRTACGERMWAAKWAEQLVETMWAAVLQHLAEWAEQLVERGSGQLNGQNSLLREDS